MKGEESTKVELGLLEQLDLANVDLKDISLCPDNKKKIGNRKFPTYILEG